MFERYLPDAHVDDSIRHFREALLHLIKQLLQPKLCEFRRVHYWQIQSEIAKVLS